MMSGIEKSFSSDIVTDSPANSPFSTGFLLVVGFGRKTKIQSNSTRGKVETARGKHAKSITKSIVRHAPCWPLSAHLFHHRHIRNDEYRSPDGNHNRNECDDDLSEKGCRGVKIEDIFEKTLLP